ncbi:DUF885 domain-containing protein [Govanella unica]|nr:DUF885 domain-containing protein [Govania unica]
MAVSLSALMTVLALSACDKPKSNEQPTSQQAPAQQSESARLNAFFDEAFKRDLKRSPMLQTYLGMKTDYNKLDDMSEARFDEDIVIAKADLERLKDFDPAKLDEQARISYAVYEQDQKDKIEGDRWRHHDYPYNQMFGWQSDLPAFMITAHTIDNKADAEGYVARLKAFVPFLGQIDDGMKLRADKGVLPPKFVFPIVIENAGMIIKGAPFDASGKDSTLLADFKGKLAKLDLPQADKDKLVADATAALKDSVKPAFDHLIATLTALEPKATRDDGVWKLPDGQDYYKYRLRTMTTTDMTPEQIHQFGLSEVARIRGEMTAIKDQVGFKGSLAEFFKHLQNDPKQYYPQTDAGQKQYLADNQVLLDAMEKKLPEYFATLPKAKVELRQVEPFRAKGAAAAFYQQPSLDGTRPGYYYVNTYDMKQLPKYAMAAITYHEALPGHHMQIAINQELQGIPEFRKIANFTAYIEGWGLYAEKLAKEMGGYADPYSDFGRLSAELWRAARLVVDTGIHDKKWTREQAIKYMDDFTPNPHGDNIREIERYIVMPGQATAYKIGMSKILEARDAAKSKLGDKFDIRGFHDAVLKSGAVPLSIMEEDVRRWADQVAAGK